MRNPTDRRGALLPALLACLLFTGCTDTELVGPFFVTPAVPYAAAGEDYEYDAHAAGLTLPTTWSLETAPLGMAVDEDGVVTWAPTLDELGVHPVVLRVTDGERAVEQSWDLAVHQDFLMGTGYSPKGHASGSTDEDVVEHLVENEPFGRLIAFQTNWRESVADAGSIPDLGVFAMTARSSFGTEPVVGFGWADAAGVPDLTSDDSPLDNSWANQETRDEFLDMVTAYASTYGPSHLFLGNEVNTWYAGNMADWPNWLSMLEECYDAIKAVSPGTTVFTVFQLERLKGLGAATTGNTDPPQWNLVADLELQGKLDAVGFTSYPYFEYATPGAIPADYYDEIALHWSGPVIFTEIAWPALADPPFPGGVADQDTFVGTFFDRSKGLDLECVLWRYLHDLDDQASFPGFMEVGLRSNDGSVVRDADGSWQAEVTLRERP